MENKEQSFEIESPKVLQSSGVDSAPASVVPRKPIKVIALCGAQDVGKTSTLYALAYLFIKNGWKFTALEDFGIRYPAERNIRQDTYGTFERAGGADGNIKILLNTAGDEELHIQNVCEQIHSKNLDPDVLITAIRIEQRGIKIFNKLKTCCDTNKWSLEIYVKDSFFDGNKGWAENRLKNLGVSPIGLNESCDLCLAKEVYNHLAKSFNFSKIP